MASNAKYKKGDLVIVKNKKISRINVGDEIFTYKLETGGEVSINVGVMNLIPFPAFDGGHILFLLIEKIRGKAVSSNVEATITGIGFVLLILLMIFVTFNDVIRLFT